MSILKYHQIIICKADNTVVDLALMVYINILFTIFVFIFQPRWHMAHVMYSFQKLRIHLLFKVSSNKEFFLGDIGQNHINRARISKAIKIVKEYLKDLFKLLKQLQNKQKDEIIIIVLPYFVVKTFHFVIKCLLNVLKHPLQLLIKYNNEPKKKRKERKKFEQKSSG